MLADDIRSFAQYLMDNASKWNDLKWVMGQHANHIEECAELRGANDIHLQAELLDKAIISAVLCKLGVMLPFNDIEELEIDIALNGVVEYLDIDDLMNRRRDKFISKLQL